MISVIAAIVSAAMAVLSAVFAYIAHRSYLRGIGHDMRSEHDDLVVRVSPTFWQVIHTAYKKFREGHPELPNSINDLVRSAGPLPGLDVSSEPLDYLPSNETPHQSALWELATLIYPQSTRGDRNELECHSIIPQKNAAEFFDAASALRGFWDNWATYLGARRLSKVQAYRGQAGFIILLTYLDITHRQWTNERNKGKGEMYRLAQLLKEYA